MLQVDHRLHPGHGQDVGPHHRVPVHRAAAAGRQCSGAYHGSDGSNEEQDGPVPRDRNRLFPPDRALRSAYLRIVLVGHPQPFHPSA